MWFIWVLFFSSSLSVPGRTLGLKGAGVTCSPEVQLLSPPSPELQFLLTRKIKTKRKHTLSRWARGTVTDLQRTEAQPISVHNLKAQGFREGEGGIRRQHKEWREEGFA